MKRIILVLAVALLSACGDNSAEWSYFDEGGNKWPIADFVDTTQDRVILLDTATHLEHCAIQAAVDAITPSAATHPEHEWSRHNPKYFFARSLDARIPTMCFTDLGCVNTWEAIPSWMGIEYEIDGLYHYVGRPHELILIRGFEMPSLYGEMDFARLLFVVIHEEVHGLGYGHSHGPEMDQMIDIVYSQALKNLYADPTCRDIPNWTWENMRSSAAVTLSEVRRTVD